MAVERTVLLGSPRSTWKEWVFRNRGSIDVVMADPADSHFGHPCRLARLRGDRTVDRRFFGSLNPGRSPSLYLAALVEILSDTTESAIIQLPTYRASPPNLQLLQTAIRLIGATRILIDDRLEAPYVGASIELEVVELEAAPPATLQTALRKAQWHKLRLSSVRHTAPLSAIGITGARLGSGRALYPGERIDVGLEEALHVEICGTTLFVVSDLPIDDSSIARALDLTHTHRAQFASSAQYENLVCALVDGDGQEIGSGFVDRIDFHEGVFAANVQAVAPAPFKSVALGLLYVDSNGNETGEAKVWEI